MDIQDHAITAEREAKVQKIAGMVNELPEVLQDEALDEMEHIVRVADSVARKYIRKMEAVSA